MLDPKFILENLELIISVCARRNVPFDADSFKKMFVQRKQLLQALDGVRAQKNQFHSKDICNEESSIERSRTLKKEKEQLEKDFKDIDNCFKKTLLTIPNLLDQHVPDGGEGDVRVLREWGTIPQMSPKAVDHIALVERFNLVDFAAASRVTSSKFCYFKNQAVQIGLALVQFVMNFLLKKGAFTLLETPDLAREAIVEGTGFNPKGQASQIYSIEDHDLCLIGTSEITVAGMLSKELLDLLPKKFLALSHCFRTEAGSYGSASRGLYRLRQFTKLEMFAATRSTDSFAMFDELVGYQEEILQALGLPYRVCDIPAGDLGAPAYRKIDLEVWMPFRGERGSYGEVSSASNCTDFQSRRLDIREKGSRRLVHTLNGTALAVPRILLALLEYGQRDNNTIALPDVLVPWLGFSEIRMD